jgi:hypothetical protein
MAQATEWIKSTQIFQFIAVLFTHAKIIEKVKGSHLTQI